MRNTTKLIKKSVKFDEKHEKHCQKPMENLGEMNAGAGRDAVFLPDAVRAILRLLDLPRHPIELREDDRLSRLTAEIAGCSCFFFMIFIGFSMVFD